MVAPPGYHLARRQLTMGAPPGSHLARHQLTMGALAQPHPDHDLKTSSRGSLHLGSRFRQLNPHLHFRLPDLPDC